MAKTSRRVARKYTEATERRYKGIYNIALLHPDWTQERLAQHFSCSTQTISTAITFALTQKENKDKSGLFQFKRLINR